MDDGGEKRTLGVISDTHGLVRPEAVRALDGCELIIHAGDVGKPEVLEELREIAPVVAVRGNVDTGRWAPRSSKWRGIGCTSCTTWARWISIPARRVSAS